MNIHFESKLQLPISQLSYYIFISIVSSDHHVTIWTLVSGILVAVGQEGDGRAAPAAQDTQSSRDHPGIQPGLRLYMGGDLEQDDDDDAA